MNIQKIHEVASYINQQPLESRVYLGTDSERVQVEDRAYIDYMTCVVVHHNGNSGAKLFGWVDREPAYLPANQPRTRLVMEAYKAAEYYLALAPLILHDIEIHLDLNPDPKHKSNQALQEALGYIRGVCQQTPQIKPDAWAASIAADRLKREI